MDEIHIQDKELIEKSRQVPREERTHCILVSLFSPSLSSSGDELSMTQGHLCTIGLRIQISRLWGCSPHMGSFVPIGKKSSCGYDPACTRGHQVTGASSTWMRVLVSVPGRGGTQPTLLQSNFANHILWLKSGLVPPSHFEVRILWFVVVSLLRLGSRTMILSLLIEMTAYSLTD